jgi:hypothetical protein
MDEDDHVLATRPARDERVVEPLAARISDLARSTVAHGGGVNSAR